jgi:hypothetical protein
VKPTAEAVERLTKKLNLSTPLVAVYDSPPEKDLAPFVDAKGRTCLFAFYSLWLEGKTIVLRRGNSDFMFPDCGCPGAQRAFGLEREHPTFMAHFLTDGVGAPMGEALKATVELAQEFLDRSKPVSPSGDTVLVGPLRTAQWDRVCSVTFFVDPDHLSGVLTLAGFWSADNDLVAAPFSSGCGQMWRCLGEYDRDRLVIGCTDIAMRKYLPPEILAATVSPARFEQMLSVPEGSFLDRDWWNDLLQARNRR